MFALLNLFRRRAGRPAFLIDEYYSPLRARRADPSSLSPLDQMYAYFSPR